MGPALGTAGLTEVSADPRPTPRLAKAAGRDSGHVAEAVLGAAAHPSASGERSRKVERRNALINPLAIGVTLGGLLLDIVVPRPKPQVGVPQEPLPPLSRYRPEDTFGYLREQHERRPVASGASH
jgi:hypothetical protein